MKVSPNLSQLLDNVARGKEATGRGVIRRMISIENTRACRQIDGQSASCTELFDRQRNVSGQPVKTQLGWLAATAVWVVPAAQRTACQIVNPCVSSSS